MVQPLFAILKLVKLVIAFISTNIRPGVLNLKSGRSIFLKGMNPINHKMSAPKNAKFINHMRLKSKQLLAEPRRNRVEFAS